MIDPVTRKRITGMVIFTILFLLLLFWRLVPLAPGRIIWPGPDMALCLTFAWVLRRPEQAPVLLITLLFLVEDLMLLRPPGLWTALAVLATEAARSRESRWRDLPFMVEWLNVTLLVALMMLAQRFVMALFFLPLPALGQAIMLFIATTAAYPLMLVVLRGLVGLSRPLPADPDTRFR